MLAGRSFAQSAVWLSEDALWRNAHTVAPGMPDPWIHGAMAVLDAPGDPRDGHRLADAEHLLTHARAAIGRQPPAEQRWAHDALAATEAVIRMRQGRLLEASRLMQGGMAASARGQLCAHFRAVCALAASSSS